MEESTGGDARGVLSGTLLVGRLCTEGIGPDRVRELALPVHLAEVVAERSRLSRGIESVAVAGLMAVTKETLFDDDELVACVV